MARVKSPTPFTGPQIKITEEAGKILSKISRLTDVPRNNLASRWIKEAGNAEHARLYNLLLTGNPDGHTDPEANVPTTDHPPIPQPYDVEAPA